MSNLDSRTELALAMITTLPGWGSWAASMREVDTPFGRFGYRQASIMWLIRRDQNAGNQSTTTGIANEIGVQNSVITRAAEHLVQLGLATRTASKDDRRRQFLALTHDGILASEYIEALYITSIRNGMEDMSDDQLAKLADAVKTLDSLLTTIVSKPLGT